MSNYRRDWRSIFIFDARTTTLRNFRQKYMILGEQRGYGIRRGGNAAFRRELSQEEVSLTKINYHW
jgi:hypothetical protein